MESLEFRNTLLERYPRLPAKERLGLGYICSRVARLDSWSDIDRRTTHQTRDVEYGWILAAADIDYLPRPDLVTLKRQNVRTRDVSSVDIIPSLETIAHNSDRLSLATLVNELDQSLRIGAPRVRPWSVNVEIAERYGRQAIVQRIVPGEMLDKIFVKAVGAERLRDKLLVRGKLLGVAVCGTRRRVDEATSPCLASGIKDVYGAVDIDGMSLLGMLDGERNAWKRREMKDPVDTSSLARYLLEKGDKVPPLPDVEHVKRGLFRKPLGLTVDQTINDMNPVPSLDKRRHKMRAQKSGTTRHDYCFLHMD